MKKDGRGKALTLTHAKNVSVRLEHVQESLNEFEKKKMKFDGITSLSEFLASHMNEKYEENIASSTLRRKEGIYRIELIDFLDDKSKGAKSTQIGSLQQQLMIEKLEVKSLNKDIKAYETQISNLLTEKANLEGKALIHKTHGKEADENEDGFNTMMKVLSYFGLDTIDIKNEGVYDKGSLTGNKSIFTIEDYPDFFKWYIKNVHLS